MQVCPIAIDSPHAFCWSIELVIISHLEDSRDCSDIKNKLCLTRRLFPRASAEIRGREGTARHSAATSTRYAAWPGRPIRERNATRRNVGEQGRGWSGCSGGSYRVHVARGFVHSSPPLPVRLGLTDAASINVPIAALIASGRCSQAAATRAKSGGKSGPERPSEGLGTNTGTSPRSRSRNSLALASLREARTGLKIPGWVTTVRVRFPPRPVDTSSAERIIVARIRACFNRRGTTPGTTPPPSYDFSCDPRRPRSPPSRTQTSRSSHTRAGSGPSASPVRSATTASDRTPKRLSGATANRGTTTTPDSKRQ